MDKYEYKVRSEEISKLIDKEKYTEAVKIADTIDWRRVKSAGMLLKIAALYRISRRNEDSKEMLMLAYDRYPTNRSVVYSLCELSIELDDVVAAIEFYKQFAKLAPKDNGVYTLRYRILEAQEASLEERIEILEELKKRDYQEEWAYELAYLYHRVGLSTKCVEECDDIILWFGDGPYVMKAMELKALHVPLTEVQQTKYESMIGLADSNYSENNYQDEDYQNENYQDENYQDENYQNDNYEPENYDAQDNYSGDYIEESYTDGTYAQNDYVENGYEDETYTQSGYGNESYENQGYEQNGYSEESYGNETYAQNSYTEEPYGNDAYTENGYGDETYAQEGYTEESYENDPYAQTGYVDDGYGNLSYVEGSYQDSGYTGEFYVEQTYDTNGNPINASSYADDGYGQDAYDNAGSNYNTNAYENNNYADNSYNTPGYNTSSYAQQNSAAMPAGAGDMSQYNTINLQKVVAESMKELFPDDDDVFAEDREKYNSQENASGGLGDTRIYANAVYGGSEAGKPINAGISEINAETEDELSNAISGAEILGAKSTDAESFNAEILDIKSSSAKVPELKVKSSDTTISEGNLSSDKENVDKKGFDNENLKKENLKKENLSRESLDKKSLDEQNKNTQITAGKSPDEEDTELRTQTGRIAQMVTSVSEAAPEPHTGAVKKVLIPGEDARLIKEESDMDELRDITEKTVVEEHSRMEYNDENVYREQNLADTGTAEEAFQTTGSMNLDDVLVEWERMKLDNAKKHQEEIKQHVLTQTGKILANFDNSIKSGILGELERDEAEAQKKNIPKNKSSNDGFLNADDTGDIPQGQSKPTSEDDFDVAYISDKQKPEKTEPEKTESDIREEYITEPEHAVAHGLGGLTNDIPQESINQAAGEILTSENPIIESTGTLGTSDDNLFENGDYADENAYAANDRTEPDNTGYYGDGKYTGESESENIVYFEKGKEYTETAQSGTAEYYEDDGYAEMMQSDDAGYEDVGYVQESESAAYYEDGDYTGEPEPENAGSYEDDRYTQEAKPGNTEYYENSAYMEQAESDNMEYYEDSDLIESDEPVYNEKHEYGPYRDKELDPEDVESIAEMAKEDALKTQEIKMNTADLSSLSEKIVATTKKEAKGAKREEIREFTPEEQALFENFAVTKKIKKQIVFALDNITLAAYTGNIIITGDAGLDTVRMAKNLIKEYQTSDANFSGKIAKITGEKFNQRNIKDVFEKLNNGGIIIEKANGMREEKLYEMALNLNQEHLGIVVIMEDTKKEITKLLEKQAMIADYFNIRVDLMEMDNNALVAYAKNYALALEYSIDELGTLALYTRIANMQSGNHVVTKDEVRDIIDEAIWKSKKSKIKNFVDVLFARRYDNEDMIVLKERDFM